MSSKAKQKDKKKSKVKNAKIKLKEIAREDISPMDTAEPFVDEKSLKAASAKRKPEYKVKVLAGFDGQDDKKFENEAAEALISAAGAGYELLCVVPAPDSRKLIAFFKLSE